MAPTSASSKRLGSIDIIFGDEMHVVMHGNDAFTYRQWRFYRRQLPVIIVVPMKPAAATYIKSYVLAYCHDTSIVAATDST